MNPVVQEISEAQRKAEVPHFNVGDTVRVHFRIVEGEKERVQVFEGVVISRKGGESPQAKFTVRRVAFGTGCERVFPLHSPRVEKVEVTREGAPRRAKLYYLRERSGKAARVPEKVRVGKEGEKATAKSKPKGKPKAKPKAKAKAKPKPKAKSKAKTKS